MSRRPTLPPNAVNAGSRGAAGVFTPDTEEGDTLSRVFLSPHRGGNNNNNNNNNNSGSNHNNNNNSSLTDGVDSFAAVLATSGLDHAEDNQQSHDAAADGNAANNINKSAVSNDSNNSHGNNNNINNNSCSSNNNNNTSNNNNNSISVSSASVTTARSFNVSQPVFPTCGSLSPAGAAPPGAPYRIGHHQAESKRAASANTTAAAAAASATAPGSSRYATRANASSPCVNVLSGAPTAATAGSNNSNNAAGGVHSASSCLRPKAAQSHPQISLRGLAPPQPPAHAHPLAPDRAACSPSSTHSSAKSKNANVWASRRTVPSPPPPLSHTVVAQTASPSALPSSLPSAAAAAPSSSSAAASPSTLSSADARPHSAASGAPCSDPDRVSVSTASSPHHPGGAADAAAVAAAGVSSCSSPLGFEPSSTNAGGAPLSLESSATPHALASNASTIHSGAGAGPLGEGFAVAPSLFSSAASSSSGFATGGGTASAPLMSFPSASTAAAAAARGYPTTIVPVTPLDAVGAAAQCSPSAAENGQPLDTGAAAASNADNCFAPITFPTLPPSDGTDSVFCASQSVSPVRKLFNHRGTTSAVAAAAAAAAASLSTSLHNRLSSSGNANRSKSSSSSVSYCNTTTNNDNNNNNVGLSAVEQHSAEPPRLPEVPGGTILVNSSNNNNNNNYHNSRGRRGFSSSWSQRIGRGDPRSASSSTSHHYNGSDATVFRRSAADSDSRGRSVGGGGGGGDDMRNASASTGGPRSVTAASTETHAGAAPAASETPDLPTGGTSSAAAARGRSDAASSLERGDGCVRDAGADLFLERDGGEEAAREGDSLISIVPVDALPSQRRFSAAAAAVAGAAARGLRCAGADDDHAANHHLRLDPNAPLFSAIETQRPRNAALLESSLLDTAAQSGFSSSRPRHRRHRAHHSLHSEATEDTTDDPDSFSASGRKLRRSLSKAEHTSLTAEAAQLGFRAPCLQVPLHWAVLVNMLIVVAIVSVITLVPMDFVGDRLLRSATKTLSASLAATIADSVRANLYFLPLSVRTFTSAWLYSPTAQKVPWTEADMPDALQDLCEAIRVSYPTSHLLYFYLSSPISGFGAYCSAQYEHGTVTAGRYTMGRSAEEAVPRYYINTTSLLPEVPLRPYPFVDAMTEAEYTIDFGGECNPWNAVAVPWYEQQTGRQVPGQFQARQGTCGRPDRPVCAVPEDPPPFSEGSSGASRAVAERVAAASRNSVVPNMRGPSSARATPPAGTVSEQQGSRGSGNDNARDTLDRGDSPSAVTAPRLETPESTWWLFHAEHTGVVTYTYPFIDYKGNLAVITAGLQPHALEAIFPAGQLFESGIGQAMILHPTTGLVLLTSWLPTPWAMQDKWNETAMAEAGIAPPRSLYLDNITDDFMVQAVAALGGLQGIANCPPAPAGSGGTSRSLSVSSLIPKRVSAAVSSAVHRAMGLPPLPDSDRVVGGQQWSKEFHDGSSKALAIATRIEVGYGSPMQLVLVYGIRRSEYAANYDSAQRIIIGIVVGVVIVIAAVDAGIVYFAMRPLRSVTRGMRRAAQLRDGIHRALRHASLLSEVSEIQRNFVIMNSKLLRMKTFVPQGVLEAMHSITATSAGADATTTTSGGLAGGAGDSVFSVTAGEGVSLTNEQHQPQSRGGHRQGSLNPPHTQQQQRRRRAERLAAAGGALIDVCGPDSPLPIRDGNLNGALLMLDGGGSQSGTHAVVFAPGDVVDGDGGECENDGAVLEGKRSRSREKGRANRADVDGAGDVGDALGNCSDGDGDDEEDESCSSSDGGEATGKSANNHNTRANSGAGGAARTASAAHNNNNNNNNPRSLRRRGGLGGALVPLNDEDVAYGEERGGGGAGGPSSGERAAAQPLGGGRLLFERVNYFKRQYCSIVVFCLHLRPEVDNTVAVVEVLCQQFMEAVIPAVLRHGGVIESQLPDCIVASFGAHSRLPMHQTRAARCALEANDDAVRCQRPRAAAARALSAGPRLCTLVDACECLVGTCGAANRNARVTFRPLTVPTTDIIRVSKTTRAPVLATQRLAATLDEDIFTLPVDVIVGGLDNRRAVLYELRGRVTRGYTGAVQLEAERRNAALPLWMVLPSAATRLAGTVQVMRRAFYRMMRGEYAEALPILRPMEEAEPQARRLAQVCRTLVERGITRPYARAAGLIRLSPAECDYEGTLQLAAGGTDASSGADNNNNNNNNNGGGATTGVALAQPQQQQQHREEAEAPVSRGVSGGGGVTPLCPPLAVAGASGSAATTTNNTAIIDVYNTQHDTSASQSRVGGVNNAASGGGGGGGGGGLAGFNWGDAPNQQKLLALAGYRAKSSSHHNSHSRNSNNTTTTVASHAFIQNGSNSNNNINNSNDSNKNNNKSQSHSHCGGGGGGSGYRDQANSNHNGRSILNGNSNNTTNASGDMAGGPPCGSGGHRRASEDENKDSMNDSAQRQLLVSAASQSVDGGAAAAPRGQRYQGNGSDNNVSNGSGGGVRALPVSLLPSVRFVEQSTDADALGTSSHSSVRGRNSNSGTRSLNNNNSGGNNNSNRSNRSINSANNNNNNNSCNSDGSGALFEMFEPSRSSTTTPSTSAAATTTSRTDTAGHNNNTDGSGDGTTTATTTTNTGTDNITETNTSATNTAATTTTGGTSILTVHSSLMDASAIGSCDGHHNNSTNKSNNIASNQNRSGAAMMTIDGDNCATRGEEPGLAPCVSELPPPLRPPAPSSPSSRPLKTTQKLKSVKSLRRHRSKRRGSDGGGSGTSAAGPDDKNTVNENENNNNNSTSSSKRKRMKVGKRHRAKAAAKRKHKKPRGASKLARGELPLRFCDLDGCEWVRSREPVGAGTSAAVYRGLSSNGSLAALKCFVLRAQQRRALGAEGLTAVVEEVQMLSSLQHENIVQFISVYASSYHLIQIIELVPGGSLDTLLHNFGRLSTGAVRRFARDIIRGLAYLHSRGIVHCDLKPHNVLLAMDGQCKLADFGSAMAKAAGASVGYIDDVLEMRGTPGYMAPEVARGELPQFSSDVFSLGVALLELLQGTLPWQYADADEGEDKNSKNNNTNNNNSSNNNSNNNNINNNDEGNEQTSVAAAAAGEGHSDGANNANTNEGATGNANAADGWGNDSRDSAAAAAAGTPHVLRRRPIELVMRNATQMLVLIGRGTIVPRVPHSLPPLSLSGGGGAAAATAETASTADGWQPLEPDLIDFLSRCVNPDPLQRATAEELLSHPWML